MYKILFVEDDNQKRKYILECIDFEELGFKICGEADNGYTALDIFIETAPDVVITDIRMPYMDGIELLKKIVESNFPTPKLVIISGFSEFEYAKKAVAMHVSEYILKPIDISKFKEILTKVKNELDEEKKKKENSEFFKNYYSKSINILQERLIHSLLIKSPSNISIEERFKIYGMKFSGSTYIATVLQVDSLVGGRRIEYSELDRFNLAVFNIVSELIKKKVCGYCAIVNNNIVIIISADEKNRGHIIKNCTDINDAIIHQAKKDFNIEISSGIGSIVDRISDIVFSYQEAIVALDYSKLYGGSKSLYIENIESNVAKSYFSDNSTENKFINIVKVGTKESLNDFVNMIFKEKTSVDITQKYVIMFIGGLIQSAEAYNIAIEDILARTETLLQFARHGDINAIKDWVINFSSALMGNIEAKRGSYHEQLVKKAKAITNERYWESDLGISKICEELFVSESYFCFVFKKITYSTFINYITNIRMQKAKEYLLNTNEKIYHIAEKVGFLDANYFSCCFKKKLGITPSEFRTKNR